MAIVFFCAAFAAGIMADELGHIIACHIRRHLRKWRKAKMKCIMAKTNDPWTAPGAGR